MQTQTDLVLVLSIGEMKSIIAKMEANKRSNSDLSDTAKFVLCHDTDYRAHRIDRSMNGYQFSGYQECNGMSVELSETTTE